MPHASVHVHMFIILSSSRTAAAENWCTIASCRCRCGSDGSLPCARQPNAGVYLWFTLLVCIFKQFRLSQFASNCRFCEANNTLFVCDGEGERRPGGRVLNVVVRRLFAIISSNCRQKMMWHCVASPVDLCIVCVWAAVIGAKRLLAELSQFEPLSQQRAQCTVYA